MNLYDKILTGAIGGLITGLLIPIFNYFMPRLLNSWLTTIHFTERIEGDYKVYNLVIHNRSLVTLKNIYASVTIDNQTNDIHRQNRFETFCSDAKVDYGMLSWSKNIDNKNFPHIDINQGETHQINFLRLHGDNDENVIEIASEQGFYGKDESKKITTKSRIVLKNNRNYNFQIAITGDNFWPKHFEAHYNYNNKMVTK